MGRRYVEFGEDLEAVLPFLEMTCKSQVDAQLDNLETPAPTEIALPRENLKGLISWTWTVKTRQSLVYDESNSGLDWLESLHAILFGCHTRQHQGSDCFGCHGSSKKP